jgi:hypothetical protein
MPKLILFAATLFSGPSRQRGGTAAEAHAQTIRSRVASRRLRAFDPHAPWVDRGPLDLSRRH